MDQVSLHATKNTARPLNAYEKVKRLYDFENGGPRKILNVGSGSGILDQFLRDKGHEVVSLDILKPENFSQLKPSEFIETDINLTWPVSSNSFDVIICTDVPEHLYDPQHILREARQVLKPDGKLIFGVPNHFDLRQRLQMLFGKGIVHWDNVQYDEKAWLYAHIRFFNLADLEAMFESARWQIQKYQFNFMAGGIIPVRFTPRFLRLWLLYTWPALFSGKIIVLASCHEIKDQPKYIYLSRTPKGL